MSKTVDVIVVGAGIAGLAHAWAAAKRGHRVAVYESSPYARGASIRNFGMVWPIGQLPGQDYESAMLTRSLWLEAAESAGFWVNPVGSICLAVHDDELAVLREFVESGLGGAPRCALLNAEQTMKHCPAANPHYVIGGMFSDTEVGVDPRQAIASLARMLADRHAVELEFNCPVVGVEPGAVLLASGQRVQARERVVLCSGAETRLLYPGLLEQAGAVPCVLQMLATRAQPAGFSLGPMVYSGPSLGHYQAYAHCPSLAAMRARHQRENPQWQQHGIHFMASHQPSGELILGDSHDYGPNYGPDRQEQIDQLLLSELYRLLALPTEAISRRWQGVYLKLPGSTHVMIQPQPGVLVFNALGGAGMTLALGLAERYWSKHS